MPSRTLTSGSARLEAELVVQAKWREHPNRDAPEHVRDQAELWSGHARTELEWVPGHLKMRL